MKQLSTTRRALAALRAVLLMLLCGSVLSAAPAYYLFTFTITYPPGGLNTPPPTGSFIYDSNTGIFSDFVVTFLGNSQDLTSAANAFGPTGRLKFELGYLGPNLINGYGPMGPDYSYWYATPSGFYGFEWRTPAQDFLAVDLTNAPRGTLIGSDPQRFSGTWSTTLASPEPGTFILTGLALAAGIALLRRRSRTAAVPFSHNSARTEWPPSWS